MTAALGTLALAAAASGLAVGWLAWNAARLDVKSPERLVAELRLAQVAALLLVLAAGTHVGAAIAGGAAGGGEMAPGAGLDVALATGFLVVAALATTWAPARALTALATAWIAHGLVGQAHHAHLLPAGGLPAWYLTASAVHAACMAGMCYLPTVWRR